MKKRLFMDRQSEVKSIVKIGTESSRKFVSSFNFYKYILIFNKQGQKLQALEFMDQPTKDPKRPKSLVWLHFGDKGSMPTALPARRRTRQSQSR